MAKKALLTPIFSKLGVDADIRIFYRYPHSSKDFWSP